MNPLANKHPKEMYLLALTEMCQRFAFWGIANLLVLYLVQQHHFSDSRADALFGAFTGLAFVLPILGGYIADRIGYRLPIIWGTLSTAFACFLIATGIMSLVYLALFFAAIGASLFTPSIYALLGKVYAPIHSLRESGFTIYYAAVNLGVFIALIVLGAFGQEQAWSIAYVLAGMIQLLGLIPFFKVLKSPALSSLKTLSLSHKKTQRSVPKLKKYEKKRIGVICILALFSVFFWMAYNQGGSSMNLFALRYTDRHILHFQMPAAWLLSAETLFLVMLAFPLATLYLRLKRRGKDPSPPLKTALSLIAIGICFVIMYRGARLISPGASSGSISPWYLLSAYFFMALGEMLIMPIGLALVTHLSPHRYTAFLVGVWYVCLGAALYLGGLLAGLMSFLHALKEFFSLFIFASFIPALVLLYFSKKLERRTERKVSY